MSLFVKDTTEIIWESVKGYLGFPSGSDGRESASNSEDLSEGCGQLDLHCRWILYHWGSPTVRTAIMKKITTSILGGCGENGAQVHCWWECKFVRPIWKPVWRALKILRIELPYDPLIPPLGIHLKQMKALIRKDISTPMFTATLFIIAKI